jgi:hypothetical protein
MTWFLDQAELLSTLWLDMASKILSASLASTANGEAANAPENARKIRSAMFQALSQHAEKTMRSPEFLQAMKQSMDAAIESRKQMDGLLTRARHETQGTARQDIDALLSSIQHLEKRLLDRIDQLSVRLDALEKKPRRRSRRKVP